MKPELFTIMRTEIKSDVYHGDNCDEHRNYFNTSCDGDMQDEDHTNDIVIDCEQFPPGTIITVQIPCCPGCGTPRQDTLEFNNGSYNIIGHENQCECGFDWVQWEEEQYS